MSAQPVVLCPAAAATHCGLSQSYLARLRQEGETRRPGLPIGPRFCRVGRKVVYRRVDLDMWIASLSDRPPLPPLPPRRGRPKKTVEIARRSVQGG